jgi:ATP-dependent Zn protease
MYGTGNSSGSFIGPKLLRNVLIALGIFILAVFVVDKLVLTGPERTTELAAVIAHLDRKDVRRVVVPARTIALELNDGTRLTASVPADRDLWPLIRRSGADVALTSAAAGETPLLGYVFQFVPFVIMALLLIFILRTANRQHR